jgi:hypothetical protein
MSGIRLIRALCARHAASSEAKTMKSKPSTVITTGKQPTLIRALEMMFQKPSHIAPESLSLASA